MKDRSEPEIPKEECNFHSCKNEVTATCKFCKRNFCDVHIKAKHTGSRAYISSLTDPYWIKRYDLDNGPDGHVDPEYTIYEKKKHEEDVAEYNANSAKAFGSILSPEEEWKILTSSIRCNGSVPSSTCDNKLVHVCSICKRAYCAYHANRKSTRFPDPNHLDGHVCKR